MFKRKPKEDSFEKDLDAFYDAAAACEKTVFNLPQSIDFVRNGLDLLDRLPEDHQERSKILLRLYRHTGSTAPFNGRNDRELLAKALFNEILKLLLT